MLCRVREVVLAYKHVGGKVPIDRQGPDHRQSERALSVEHFRSAWLGANHLNYAQIHFASVAAFVAGWRSS